MQQVAEAWLVLQLTNSPFYLGLNGFANTIPLALFTFWGGVIADQTNRRKLLMATQWAMLGLALSLGLLASGGWLSVWSILLISALAGVVQAIAWPAYQSILANIVSAEELPNAIALNSTQFNVARTIGPVLGAWGLAHFGAAGCFFANAASFLAVILSLFLIREIHEDKKVRPRTGLLESFREGFRYMRSEKTLLWFFLIMAMTSIFGVPLVTLLPAFARDVLHMEVRGFGLLIGSFGVGAIGAGIFVASTSLRIQRGRWVMKFLFLFVAAMLAFTFSRTPWISMGFMALAGFSMVGYASLINTIAQSTAPDHMRGRAMSVFVFSFGGCMPIGNLLAGTLARHWGTPETLLCQAMALGVFALVLYVRHPEVVSHP